MNIVRARPPNFDKIAAAFPVATRRRGILFAYGHVIYNPDGVDISPALAAHEEAHGHRQRIWGDNPEGWWNCYIIHPRFRLEEEIIAHRVEWKVFLAQGFGRHQRRAYLSWISSRLASPLYGSLITTARAKEIIGADPNSRHPDNPLPAAPV